MKRPLGCPCQPVPYRVLDPPVENPVRHQVARVRCQPGAANLGWSQINREQLDPAAPHQSAPKVSSAGQTWLQHRRTHVCVWALHNCGQELASPFEFAVLTEVNSNSACASNQIDPNRAARRPPRSSLQLSYKVARSGAPLAAGSSHPSAVPQLLQTLPNTAETDSRACRD